MTDADGSKFGPADDGPHPPGSDDRWETETFWFSFFDSERCLGGWLYSGLRHHMGTTYGGAWVWDAHTTAAWDLPFFEQFSGLRLPKVASAERIEFPTGLTIATRVPLTSYELSYDDRQRFRAELRFDASHPPAPLLSGAPPYPKAHHFDQTGRLRGTLVLDDQTVPIDCYAMRDRSWGPRNERGYRRVGYSWAADESVSLLTYSMPTPDRDDIHAGYVARGDRVSRVLSGRRAVRRDPDNGWVTGMDLEAVDEHGQVVQASGTAVSRMFLPGATAVTVNTMLHWEIDGRTMWGEDQDVWPTREWRRTRFGPGFGPA